VDVEDKPGRDGSRRKELISRNFAEPSDGLEPSTPSLPSFDLQIGALRHVTRVLAYPRVVDLMYPSRTRALLSVLKTDNGERG
jgi:hypothetical protein